MIFLSGTGLWAQNTAVLVYADDDAALELIDSSGTAGSLYIGEEIKSGETVRTHASSAELQLQPNRSIIKIAPNTVFVLESLGSADTGDANEFALLSGKIRAVAARTSGLERYRIRTPSAVAGVRGTDFSLSVIEGAKDALFVRSGLVEFSRTLVDGTSQVIMVGAGQFADAFASNFAPLTPPADQIEQEFGNLEFTSLDPQSVPEGPETLSEAETEEEESTETPEEAVEENEAEAAEDALPPDSTTIPQLGKMPVDSDTDSQTDRKTAADSKFFAWMGDVLGFEIGSVIIDGQTYSKAIIQPVFSVGKLRMGLYMPIIYTSDLFDTDTWYHPRGNNEWSFGAEYWDDDPYKASMDALTDVALKIRFMEYGQPLVDPFYLKVGNLNTMSIGHGILMRNFANDSDFPAVRRIGLNTGFDAGSWGAEAVVNDLSEPEIFGGRFNFLHIFGLSAIADIDPAGELESNEERHLIGDPILVGTAFDIDIPILNLQYLNLRAFADLGAIIPYTRYDLPGGPSAGFQYKTIYDSDRGSGLDALQNYGFISGLMGKFLLLDYRLEFRHYRGAFKPTLFDSTYERNRVQYASEFAALLYDDQLDSAYIVNGIYGEAGFNLFREKVIFTAGYLMPWSPDSEPSWSDLARQDYLMLRLAINKGLIPLYDISGSVSFERNGFAYAVAKKKNLFTADAVLKGELVMPIANTVDFAVVFTNAALGNEELDLENPEYKTSPTISFETRIHF